MPTTPLTPLFDHETLKVYQASLVFVAWVSTLLDEVLKSFAVQNQLDRASTSIPLNMEGSGKFTAPDRCRYYDNARGSALECAACLDVLVAKKIVCDRDVQPGKELLVPVVSMLAD